MPFSPVLRCGAQAALSPIFGAFATPVWWQARQADLTMSSPLRGPAAAAAAPNSTLPTGCRRLATASGVKRRGIARSAC